MKPLSSITACTSSRSRSAVETLLAFAEQTLCSSCCEELSCVAAACDGPECLCAACRVTRKRSEHSHNLRAQGCMRVSAFDGGKPGC
jgi:hypothetical protein